MHTRDAFASSIRNLALLLFCASVGCGTGGGSSSPAPSTGGDASDARGADPGPVAACPAATQACGANCCSNSEVCGEAGRCCDPSALCGTLCCGAGEECEVDRCVLACGPNEAACGSGAEAACCAAGEACYLGACVTPGQACTATRDCPDGQYCEATLAACLPRAQGTVCEWRPPLGKQFEMRQEWSWTGDAVMSAHNQVMMAPMVANLTDDNSDGVIDENDAPDVVFSTFEGKNYHTDGVLRAISGRDGRRIWPTASPTYRVNPGAEVAIAEVEPTSPGPEVLACSGDTDTNHLIIVAADGTLLRRFNQPGRTVPCNFAAPMVGDMDGDGTPEIAVGFTIARADGTVVQQLRNSGHGIYNALVDVDKDGQLELVSSVGVWKLDGTPLWTNDALGLKHVAVADLDLDGTAEIVTVGGHHVQALNATNGAPLWAPKDINPAEIPLGGRDPSGGGPPTIGNFDDDPNPEIALAGGYAYVVFNHDGTRLWYRETQDTSSRATGSSLFDFNGDGRAEVLYNDELTFRVMDGRNGTELLSLCNTSGTLKEFPIVVDVDGDDRAEIVLMQNNYWFNQCSDGTPSGNGIRVFGHPRGEWVRTRRIFNQHSYHVTNINEDGTVPVREARHYEDARLNAFRLNLQPDGLFDAPDLVVRDLAAEVNACPSFRLSARVFNVGAAGAPAGVPVTFYAVGADQTQTRIGKATTPRALLPGESALVELTTGYTPSGSPSEPQTFIAVVNDPTDGPVEDLNECKPDNNGSDPLITKCTLLL